MCLSSQIVVMACREVEMGKNKCERYWPQVGQSMDVGAMKVTTVSSAARYFKPSYSSGAYF
jgi:protein tyrosine phosphatase